MNTPKSTGMRDDLTWVVTYSERSIGSAQNISKKLDHPLRVIVGVGWESG